MAHFAQLDENNVVVQVIVVNNEVIQDLPFPESESVGVAFCQSLYGADTVWKQTSYNGNFRGVYAEVGYSYDPVLDVFVSPKPEQYPSWVLDSQTAEWVPPIPRPTDTVYTWHEQSLSWIQIPQPYASWTAQGDPLQWVPPVPFPKGRVLYRWDEPNLSWVEVVTP